MSRSRASYYWSPFTTKAQYAQYAKEYWDEVRRQVPLEELSDFGFGAELYKRMRNPETFHVVMCREIDFDMVKQEAGCE